VEPTLIIGVKTMLCIGDGPILPQTLVQDGGDEDIETKSKDKENIAKDGLGPSK
jgi:hypothetical protein